MMAGVSKGGALGTVEIITTLGDQYRLPSMDKDALTVVLEKGSNRLPEGFPTLALVNASYAVLSIPFNIIKTINVDGDLWWSSPV